MDVASRASWRLNVWSNNVHGAATVYKLVAPEASTGLEYASAAPLRGFGCSRNDLLIGREEALQVLGTSLVGHAGGAFNSQKLLHVVYFYGAIGLFQRSIGHGGRSLELLSGEAGAPLADSYASGELLRGCGRHLVAGKRKRCMYVLRRRRESC